MPKYRKKPVVVEAVRYSGNDADAADFVGDAFLVTVTETGIQTLEGFMRVSIGDYIIKGVQGEFYPCKPVIFHATHEEVSDCKHNNTVDSFCEWCAEEESPSSGHKG